MKKNVRISLLPKEREVAGRDCNTCTKRRIKCDRTAPNCKKCTTRGLQCPGYSQSAIRWRPVVVSKDRKDQIRRQSQLIVTTSGSRLLHENELKWADRLATATLSNHLLTHFLNDTARRLVWLDEHSNPWRSHICPLSERSPLLRLCLLTLSAAHIAAISGKDFDNDIYQASRDASVRALSINISNNMMSAESQEDCTEVIAGIITLCYGDLFVKHTPDQALHLHACRIAGDTGLLLQEQTGTLNETLQFAIKEAMELEANANMFSFHQATIVRAPTFFPDKKPFWLFTGFIHEVTAAERELHSSPGDDDFFTAEQSDLNNWISKLESAKGSILAETCSDNCLTPTCCGQLKGGPLLETVVHLNYLACLVYTYQSICPNAKDDSRLGSTTSSLLDSFKSLSHDSEPLDPFAHDIYWPLFIAGTISSSDRESQEAITHMFMRSIKRTGHWCNYDALQFLKIFWEGVESRDTNWLAFARRRMGTIPSFTVF